MDRSVQALYEYQRTITVSTLSIGGSMPIKTRDYNIYIFGVKTLIIDIPLNKDGDEYMKTRFYYVLTLYCVFGMTVPTV